MVSFNTFGRRPSLLIICLVGFCARIAYLLISDHIYYPDEIFQTLEPAYRLVHGYGLIPWDYRYGLRSYLIPYFLSLPLYLTPSLFFTRLVLSFLSLVLILAMYRLAWLMTNSRHFAQSAALVTALWYELIYFAPRALTETLATYVLGLAFILPKSQPYHFFLFGLLLSFSGLIRPQYFLVCLCLYFYTTLHRSRRQISWALIGIMGGVIIFGLSDLFTYGQFLVHLPNNLRLSLLTGISSLFGTQPFSYYFVNVTIATSGLILFIVFTYKHPQLKYLTFLYALIILLHSFIPHKEYRFIFILIPLGLVLILSGLSTTLARFQPHLTAKSLTLSLSLMLSVSFLGLLDQLPGETKLYPQPPLMRDSLLKLLGQVPLSASACSLYIPDRDWVYSGGYTYLRQSLSLYTHDYPPPTGYQPHFLILPTGLTLPTQYLPLTSSAAYTFYLGSVKTKHPGYTLYAQSLDCVPPSSYSYDRSFSYLEPILARSTRYP